jgi:hypothetical protein
MRATFLFSQVAIQRLDGTLSQVLYGKRVKGFLYSEARIKSCVAYNPNLEEIMGFFTKFVLLLMLEVLGAQ